MFKVFKQIFVLAKQRLHRLEKSRYNWFQILSRKVKVDRGHIYMFDTFKKLCLCFLIKTNAPCLFQQTGPPCC